MIQIGRIENTGSSAVAITEGMDVNEVEVSDEALKQHILGFGFPEGKPLIHKLWKLFRGGRGMDDAGSRTNVNHAIPVLFAHMLGVFAHTIYDFYPESANVFNGNGPTVGIVAGSNCIDNHSVIFGFGIGECFLHLIHSGSGTFDGGRGPGIQQNGVFDTSVNRELFIQHIEFCGSSPKCRYTGQKQFFAVDSGQRKLYTIIQTVVQFLNGFSDIGAGTILQFLNGIPHRSSSFPNNSSSLPQKFLTVYDSGRIFYPLYTLSQ